MSYVAALHLYRIKLGTKSIRSLRLLQLGQGRRLYKGGGGYVHRWLPPILQWVNTSGSQQDIYVAFTDACLCTSTRLRQGATRGRPDRTGNRAWAGAVKAGPLLSSIDRQMQRGLVVLVCFVDVGARVDQQLRHFKAPVPDTTTGAADIPPSLGTETLNFKLKELWRRSSGVGEEQTAVEVGADGG